MKKKKRSGGDTQKGKAVRPASRSIVWTSRAISDLEVIGDFIAKDNSIAAARWVATLVSAAERVASLPFTGRRVPELSRDDVREIILRNYRIVYLVTLKHIEILTLFEGHRRLPGGVGQP